MESTDQPGSLTSQRSKEIHVLGHKLRLLQPWEGFRTSLDSVLVAAAVPVGPAQSARVLDLGAGVGGASFCLLWRATGVHVTGVEIQPSHVALAQQNIALNAMEGRVDFIEADVRIFSAPVPFDYVLCNPPYLEGGEYTPSPSPERATALGHKDSETTLDHWVQCAARNLCANGGVVFIHRADAVDRLLQSLGRLHFGAVEIIPLWPRAGEEARRVIVRARKDRKTPARLYAGIVLHQDGSSEYTLEAEAILRDGIPILPV